MTAFEEIFNDFFTHSSNLRSYPPTDVIKLSEYDYLVQMAVAGFAPDELTIEKNGLLVTVRGQKKVENGLASYITKSISTKPFKQQIRLRQDSEVTETKLDNGLLQIFVTVNIPEEEKPRQIPIGFKATGLIEA